MNVRITCIAAAALTMMVVAGCRDETVVVTQNGPGQIGAGSPESQPVETVQTKDESDMVRLHLETPQVTEDGLVFKYSVENAGDVPVWRCMATDANVPLPCSVQIDHAAKRAVLSQTSFMVPGDVFLEEPIWALYEALAPGDTHNGEVRLELPLRTVNPVSLGKNRQAMESHNVETIEFRLGIIRADLVQLKSEACRGDSTAEKAYVSCFWVEEHPEDVLTATLTGVAIPAADVKE